MELIPCGEAGGGDEHEKGRLEVKRINKNKLYLLFAVMLASCNRVQTTSTPNPVMETFILAARTDFAKTQASIATPTASPVFTALPDPFGVSTPNPGRQIYLDPQGWYFVNLPADMEPKGDPGSFEGPTGLFETGYLPEMGYVSGYLQVCLWYANMVAKPEQSSINLHIPNGGQPNTWRCDVMVDAGNKTGVGIFENPGADPAHRFIYTKWTNKGAGFVSAHPIGWLKPFSEEPPPFVLAPLTPEETAFWESAAPMPANITIKEYILPPEAQKSSPLDDYQFWKYVPPEAFPTRMPSAQDDKPSVEEQLHSIGYELRKGEPYQGFSQLYRDGRILFDQVAHVSDVYQFTTEAGPLTAFLVETLPSVGTGFLNRFLVQNDAIYHWNYTNNDPRFAPVLYQDELLWVRAVQNAHVQVQKSSQEVVFDFTSYYGATLEVDKFRGWDGHWILEAGGMVAQDGELLNRKFDFQEVHDWGLVNGHPFYFFRKGQRVGISYNSQFLPVFYHEVVHGGCCGYAAYNPRFSNNTVGFYAKREGVWMYVLVEIR